MGVKKPGIFFAFDFESNFDVEASTAWMRARWHHSIYYAMLYVAAIHLGQHYMASRPAFHLRTPMAIWSACLACFSILGLVRSASYIPYIMWNYGLHKLFCDDTFYYHVPTGFWAYIFAASKLYELGDSVFVVLRKQNMKFLHWYHHATVLIYCWKSYSLHSPSGFLLGFMNYAVHSLMYTYYTLKAMKVWTVPRLVNMSITALQIMQMFAGIAITITAYYYKTAGLSCAENYENLKLAMGMYLTYMLLFINFFYQAYFKQLSRKKRRPLGFADRKCDVALE